MRLSPGPLNIPSHDPFKHDLLGREQVAEVLTNLVRGREHPLVISLHGRWGSGKTTFLQMWQSHLRIEGAHALYFNAWESDLQDDPLAALFGELETELKRIEGGRNPEQRSPLPDAVKALSSTGLAVLKAIGPLALRVGTGLSIDFDQSATGPLSEYVEKLSESRIKQHEASKQSVKAFRKALESVAKDCSNGDDLQRFPLVVIVDELDRCRPSYSVKVLECIKHIFSVPNVTFLVAVDKVQLGHSMRTQYGLDMDVAGYLRRFFDLDLTLPPADLRAFASAQYDAFSIANSFDLQLRKAFNSRVSTENAKDFLLNFFHYFSCDLREIERCFTLLAMALTRQDANGFDFFEITACLIVLKVKEPILYSDFVSGRAKAHSILQCIRRSETGKEYLSSRAGHWFTAVLIAVGFPYREMERAIAYCVEVHADTSIPKPDEPRLILDMLASNDMRPFFGRLQGICAKIDLANTLAS